MWIEETETDSVMTDGDEGKSVVVVMMMSGENQEVLAEMTCGEVVIGMILVAVAGETGVGLEKRAVAGGIKALLWTTAGAVHEMNEVHQEIQCGCVTENHPLHEMMIGKTEE